MVAEKPKPKAPAMPPGGGMGGMGDMEQQQQLLLRSQNAVKQDGLLFFEVTTQMSTLASQFRGRQEEQRR
jgi:hypothetical protein